MSMTVFSIDRDLVVGSLFVTSRTDYTFALEKIVPLIKKLDIQRKIQNKKFYERLGEDICAGCIMPPLTLAFIDENAGLGMESSCEEVGEYINSNISSGFVLDGIQRLNTVKNVSSSDDFKSDRPIFFNVLICPSHDKLLYRMITLNNGQKPMTARHQIEVLLGRIYEFNGDNINIVSEKDAAARRTRWAFKKSSFINAYLAFLSDSTNIDSKKIIEEKLDELLATRIIEKGVDDMPFEFSCVIDFVGDFSRNPEVYEWFKNDNNLIGFAVGVRRAYALLKDMGEDDFHEIIKSFESAFAALDVSKIKVGSARRRYVSEYFDRLDKIMQKNMGPTETLSYLMERLDDL